MLVDSHCHLHMLDLQQYGGDLSLVIHNAIEAQVQHILCVCVDLSEVETILNISEQYNNITASVGIHPSEKLDKEPSIEEIVNLANHPKVVGIGETGLDYYYNKDNLDNMRHRFRMQIRAARQCQKPLIIHTRNAREDTINILREEKASDVGAVMHCFTESWEMAKQALDLGFYISFSGIVTFKNARNVAEVAEKVPLDRLLIETDAPYLTPVPYRGKPNEPQYVRYVAEKIAALKNISFERVAEQTTQNYFQLFGGQ